MMPRALSFLGFLLMVAGIIGLPASHGLFSMSPLVIGLQTAAVALMLWARITLPRLF